jgi:hypothetical protein
MNNCLFTKKTLNPIIINEQLKLRTLNTNVISWTSVQSALNQNHNLWPFIVKIKFLKTLKTIQPQLNYTYILPQNRLASQLKFNNYIRRNSSKYANIEPLHILEASLRI